MPVTMAVRSGFASPRGSIERGNRLGSRPVVRQSKIYRELESGNQMKGLLGRDNLAWDPSQQEGVFQGQTVYDMSSQGFVGQPTQHNGRSPMPQQHWQGTPTSPPMPRQQQQQHTQQKPARRAMFAPGTEGPVRGGGWTAVSGPSAALPFAASAAYAEPAEAEYPLPGSSASCDLCGEVVWRFYHCSDCREETGLFDLCTVCCAAVYLQQGPPQLLAKVRSLSHPTHVYATHSMVHVTPTGGSGGS